MILEIVKHPADILRKNCEPVDEIDKKTKKLIRDMKSTLNSSGGVGLAAPQVRMNKRIIIVKPLYHSSDGSLIFGEECNEMINPQIVTRDVELIPSQEGCLSIEGVTKTVKRHKSIVVKYTDVKGRHYQKVASGLEACIIQHEIDHLDGVLIIDY